MMPNRYINLHTHRPTGSGDLIEVVNVELSYALPNPLPEYCSLGIHPWRSSENTDASKLFYFSNNKQVITIGETGLDKLRGGSYEQQQTLFRKHIEVSEKLHKPLIIHCVKYFNEIITLRTELKPKQAWILHGFNGSKQLIEQAASNGLYFSFGRSLLNPKSKAAQNLKYVPMNRLFFETDDSDEKIETIYTKASKLLDTEVTDLMSITLDNFNNIFKY